MQLVRTRHDPERASADAGGPLHLLWPDGALLGFMSGKRPGSPVIKRARVSRTLSSLGLSHCLIQAKVAHHKNSPTWCLWILEHMKALWTGRQAWVRQGAAATASGGQRP